MLQTLRIQKRITQRLQQQRLPVLLFILNLNCIGVEKLILTFQMRVLPSSWMQLMEMFQKLLVQALYITNKKNISNILNHGLLNVLKMAIMKKNPNKTTKKIDHGFKERDYDWDKLEAELFNQNL